MTALLARCGGFFRSQTGWRRLAWAIAAGAFSALGFAPFSAFPCLLLGLAALVLLLDGAALETKRIRAAALTGFGFGFGQFVVGLHWIGYAFLVDAENHAWQLPFVAVLFPAFLALFMAAAAAVSVFFWKDGLARIFALTLAYSLTEWLRGHILTGFPWNLPAYGWGASLSILQAHALFGVYGFSLLTLLFGFSLAPLFQETPRYRLAAVMAGGFVLLFAWGAWRLNTTPQTAMTGVSLRLVQPDIPQAEKYERRYVLRNWQRLINLSQRPGNPSIIVWPEAAPPFLLEEQPLALAHIARLTEGRLGLMTGGLRRGFDGANTLRYTNSFFLFGHDGALLNVADKYHLVPFAEYLPFEKTLTALGLSKLTGISGSFSQGPGPQSFSLPGAGRVTPLICYEIVFSGQISPPQRPDWFVNVTDDSWFGPWAGPRQHLLIARVRAIEEGVPVVRNANTGISAIIDPFGRITASLGLGAMGVVDGMLPAPIAAPLYAQLRGVAFWFLAAACGVLVAIFSPRK